jgi:hypothetical protein
MQFALLAVALICQQIPNVGAGDGLLGNLI